MAVAGTAAPASGTVVAVANASSTSRKDRAYGAEFTPANSADPVIAAATTYAALPGGGSGGLDLIRTDTTKNYLVPKRAQVFTHDDDGNLTSDGLWTYTWNAENQLVRATCALPSGFGSALSYVRKRLDLKYDHAGRRIEKRVLNIDTSTEILARRFVYDGHNLVVELDGNGSAIQRSYTWGLDAGGSLTASSAPGSLLQITNYSGGTPGSSYYPTYDDQGNVASLVKASDGSLAAVYEYDPYGNLIRNEVLDSAVADNPFRHATNYRDEETGLVYYGYRYYDPVNGRFLNQDPIGEAGGLNLYGFIGNSGVNGSDYLGMQISSSTIRVNADAMPDDGSWGDFIGATPQPDFVGESWPYFIPRIPANPTIIFTRRTDVVGPQPPEVIEVFPPTPEDKPPTVVVTTPNPNTPPPLVPDTPTKPSSAPAGVMASGTPRGSPDVPGSKVQFAAPNSATTNTGPNLVTAAVAGTAVAIPGAIAGGGGGITAGEVIAGAARAGPLVAGAAVVMSIPGDTYRNPNLVSFRRYDYAALAPIYLTLGRNLPTTYAAPMTDPLVSSSQAQAIYALPLPNAPRDAYYIITIDPRDNPYNGPTVVQPKFGQPGGGNEVLILGPIPPGQIQGPYPLPPNPPPPTPPPAPKSSNGPG